MSLIIQLVAYLLVLTANNNTDKYNNYNNCIIVDYSLPSSKNRLFIKHDGIVYARYLVCSGKTDKKGNVIFSNKIGSNCSSLGKIEILNSYYGNYGKAYKLKGLDKTNSNIFIRNIVLHSHSCVPQKSDSEICESQGCLTVNIKDFKKIEYYKKVFKIKYIYCIK